MRRGQYQQSPEWSLILQRPWRYHCSPGARDPFKKSSREELIPALTWEKKVLRSNDVLIEKEKLALLGKSKENWKVKFSSNLEKMIELNTSSQYENH